MNKLLIAVILLIALNLINISNHLIRRKVLLGIGEVSFFSINTWKTLILHPAVWLVLVLSGCLFALNLIVFAYAGVNNVVVISYFLLIPTFLLTVLLSFIFLQEKIIPAQYVWFVMLFILMGITGYVVYKFVTVGV